LPDSRSGWTPARPFGIAGIAILSGNAIFDAQEMRQQYWQVWTMAEAARMARQEESMVLSFMDRTGKIVVNQLVERFGMSKTQLAETAGLSRETLYRTERSRSPKAQMRLREMLEIISRVADWAGGKEQAMAWYRSQPLPAFGGRTAEALVKEGKAAAVRDYLDHMALGGFA
jgi:DNA-binding XRE family transcriptional regulator